MDFYRFSYSRILQGFLKTFHQKDQIGLDGPFLERISCVTKVREHACAHVLRLEFRERLGTIARKL
jgi:hypothetical protein